MTVDVFWFSEDNGSSKTSLIDNNLVYQFPSKIPEGTVDVTFVILEGDKIGFANSSFILTRYPAEIISIEEVKKGSPSYLGGRAGFAKSWSLGTA